MIRIGDYQIMRLPNGLIRVYELGCGLAGRYHADGSYRCGDLRIDLVALLRQGLYEQDGVSLDLITLLKQWSNE